MILQPMPGVAIPKRKLKPGMRLCDLQAELRVRNLRLIPCREGLFAVRIH